MIDSFASGPIAITHLSELGTLVVHEKSATSQPGLYGRAGTVQTEIGALFIQPSRSNHVFGSHVSKPL
jgi:hypothetical protein